MAGRINSYHLFRRIHLYSAFIVMVFLAMYFITGFLMVRHQWFDDVQFEPETREIKIDLPATEDPERLAKYIRDNLAIHGKRERLEKREDGSVFIEYIRPGVTYRINVPQEDNRVIVEKVEHSLFQVIRIFHRMHRYGGGWKYDLFMFMMDLSSIALILFSITGFYLWLKILKKKSWGVAFFILGLLYTGWVLWTFTVL